MIKESERKTGRKGIRQIKKHKGRRKRRIYMG